MIRLYIPGWWRGPPCCRLTNPSSPPAACPAHTHTLVHNRHHTHTHTADHKLISRDRPAKCYIFIKELTKNHFTFCSRHGAFNSRELGCFWVLLSINIVNLYSTYGDSLIESSLTKINKLNFCQQNFFYRNITIPCLSYALAQCRNPKRSRKGPHFKEDDCTLSVYLSLLVYMQ